ncbi:MAG: TldE/PmbA family protein, partial [Actinobacteria bacterium]|nr:TldE/PmbA family protein [Actinomycetota bacterium]NIS35490.1 TldE/PmbA family protein [Actinomycetota bacterium]NIT98149.1 TldE/PmbA family protein [Actinomycetota bacterium]NIU21779.1 TldE/PmbA family protein [Actinomycetota bacterium]NIU70153.1 TldE/PmbA family protein [Actinomycetota bacterium]
DRGRIAETLRDLREIRRAMPEDPYLLYSQGSDTTERVTDAALPEPADAVDAVISGAGGSDLVGIYAAGQMFRGFASSFGQRNWSTTA